MPVVPENLGLATDLLLHAETGSVETKDRYVVVRTPQAHDYFFGNMLVLRDRPSAGEIDRLEEDFARLVGVPPSIAHRTFTWPENDAGAVDLAAFVERGYDATLCSVLTATPDQIRPAVTRANIEVRAFHSQRDWDDWAAMQLAAMPNPADPTSQRYMAQQQIAHRNVIARGMGAWWGAFIDGEQVGSLGLFFFGRIGRFQAVITSEQHRNKGICKTLISEVIRATAGSDDHLVMVADESYHAGKIYASLGFVQHGRLGSVCREPAPE
ncbi:GNAT family N-acetyltransferase [Paraburkholderia sp. BL21I4N1]|uniref:GNAT family N-acetyltransferase n=1 Tax=Paraburkholderia sp. BL21I4N1 TaxID=1938801 RepID=UPI000CFD2415|nr:GNAT family N-acetyltransferase [Paraburkholderia sp. BL21I4N1]PQV54715.1 acetyltransferase (GNAT) family protein [Paraburkholderia sp. BL21I4N1]